ncbi:LexA family transcriptional regulator [Macrococcoides canis]|uniref:helix-turn-helix domain-containing protein n=1 Tax=Macrococcoides canis TaxID=1855823 RepID=UPI001F471E2C|nr:LexA family transcriptional regulator [Macrococcus canis]UJS28452.1 LexA family transcriptional regulator [Macrococcus canis]
MLGNKEVMAKNISRLMKEKGVDRTKLSNDLKVKYTTLSDWINAKTYPRIDKIELMANYFDVSKSELVEDKSISFEKIEARKVPVVSHISAGIPIYSEENILEYAYVPAYLAVDGKDVFYLRVSGDSMDKEFKEGDLVLVEKDSYVTDGQIAVVQVNGYNATVKKVKFNGDQIVLLPDSHNTDHLPQVYTKKDEVKIIGRVISSQKFY